MNRNTMLRSRKPLKRRTHMRRKRATPRRSGRVRDREYLLAVKGLPCLLDGAKGLRVLDRTGTWSGMQKAKLLQSYLWGAMECSGSVEADHAGARPLGRKCSDDEAIPLCQKHHRERTDYTGFFAGFTAHWMRLWCDTAIAETRARLGWKAAA